MGKPCTVGSLYDIDYKKQTMCQRCYFYLTCYNYLKKGEKDSWAIKSTFQEWKQVAQLLTQSFKSWDPWGQSVCIEEWEIKDLHADLGKGVYVVLNNV